MLEKFHVPEDVAHRVEPEALTRTEGGDREDSRSEEAPRATAALAYAADEGDYFRSSIDFETVSRRVVNRQTRIESGSVTVDIPH